MFTSVLGCLPLYWVVYLCTGLFTSVLGCLPLYWVVYLRTGLFTSVLGCLPLYWVVYLCTGLFTSLYWVASKCHETHLGLKNLLLHSTLCSNYLKRLFFFKSRNVTAICYYGIETHFQNLAIYSTCERLLSEATGNSDSHSQNAILETTDNTSSRDIEVRKKFYIIVLAEVWSLRLHTYIYRELSNLIGRFGTSSI